MDEYTEKNLENAGLYSANNKDKSVLLNLLPERRVLLDWIDQSDSFLIFINIF